MSVDSTHHNLEKITALVRAAPYREGVPTARFENTIRFRNGLICICKMQMTKRADNEIERAIVVRQLLGIASAKRHSWIVRLCLCNHFFGKV